MNIRELKNILEKRKSDLRIGIAQEKVKTCKDPLEIMEQQMRLVELNSVLYVIENAVAPDIRKEAKSLEKTKDDIYRSMYDQIKQSLTRKLKKQNK